LQRFHDAKSSERRDWDPRDYTRSQGMTPLLIATTNPGKLREIAVLLRGLPLTLPSLGDLPPIVEPEETAGTFAGNARIKAGAYARASGLVTVAEDSGLAIDALGGAPGVHSARYPGATYPDKFRNLYAALAAHPRPWAARYVCALAVVDGRVNEGNATIAMSPTVTFETQATVEGEIWPEPRGTHGFGYDPVFYYAPYGRTFGEVGDEEKLAVAHRGRAFLTLRRWIETGGLGGSIRA
jgi:XTP/dITP diphosphohydrolase